MTPSRPVRLLASTTLAPPPAVLGGTCTLGPVIGRSSKIARRSVYGSRIVDLPSR